MSTTGTVTIIETYNVHCCSECGVSYAITDAYDDRRRQDHATFYCPNGHGQSYRGKTEAEKQRERAQRLEQQLANRDEDLRIEQTRHLSERNAHRATKGVLTKTKKRVANGVCPCCQRHFVNVERHMANQHPNYAETSTS